jgi:hypothetical protein
MQYNCSVMNTGTLTLPAQSSNMTFITRYKRSDFQSHTSFSSNCLCFVDILELSLVLQLVFSKSVPLLGFVLLFLSLVEWPVTNTVEFQLQLNTLLFNSQVIEWYLYKRLCTVKGHRNRSGMERKCTKTWANDELSPPNKPKQMATCTKCPKQILK